MLGAVARSLYGALVGMRSRATERELVIMAPTVFLRVHSRLHFSTAVCSRATRSHHAEPCVLQRVERLLDERVFEEEAGRVAVRSATVWIISGSSLSSGP